MPMIEVTEEELERRKRRDVMERLLDVWRDGDPEEGRRIAREFAPSAEVLLHAKRVHGVDWLRRQGFKHASRGGGVWPRLARGLRR